MEFIITLAIKFWQWTILIAVVIIGWLINVLDKRRPNKLKFTYTEFPHMQPMKISTKDKGFFKGILMWLLSTRNWTITKDWHYNIDGTDYVIPAGFTFDGASIPKFLRTFFSPVGVLLMGGLVHDYGYKYATLLKKNKKETIGTKDQASYLPQTDKWRQDKLQEMYTPNGDLTFMLVPDRSLYTLQQYGIKITEKEYLAIKCHDGVFADGNKPYFFSNNPNSRMKTSIVNVLHCADFLASKVEYDKWLSDGGDTSPKTKKTKSSTGKRVNSSQGLKNMLNKL